MQVRLRWPGSRGGRTAGMSGRRTHPSCCAARGLAGSAVPAHAGQLASPAVAGAIAGAAQGVDVAAFQHPGGAAISWTDVAAAGIQFAAIKATEGTYYRNPHALSDLAKAKSAGLSVDAYAFAIPNGNGGRKSPTAQAAYLLRYLGTDSSTVPIMLDIEYDPYVSQDRTNECYGLRPAAMASWVSAFDAEIHRETGRLPVIYTPPSWWRTCVGGSTGFRRLPLWDPDYTSAASPALPAGWRHWSIWQYTSAGNVNGIDDRGHTDLDQLNPGVIALLDPGHHRNAVGHPVHWRLKRAEPVPSQRPSFSATGLPAGTSVHARGRVTGAPDRPGTYRVKVTATASSGASGSVSFTWTVRSAAGAGR